MRRRTFGLLGASIAMASGLWLACGGSDGTIALVPDPDSGAPEGGNADTGSNGKDSSAPDASDGGTIQPEAGGGDGGINPPDAGPGGTTTVLTCGSTTCAIPTQSCCIDRVGGGGMAYGCAASCPGIDAGVETAALKCSGQSNCAAGTVCCVQQAGKKGASSECKATCGNDEAQLCAPGAAVSGCVGTACSSANIGDWALPDTYATCGGVGN